MTLHFIDSHAHMTDPAFDADRAAVTQAAFDAGVKNIIEIGCDVDEWAPALEFARAYDGKIFAALGLHPSCMNNYSENAMQDLKQFLQDPKAVALGEVGLDYVHMSVGAEEQKQFFSNILKLVKDNPKPIVLHARKNNDPQDYGVYNDMFEILKRDWTPVQNHEGVLHCFSGRYEDACAALDLGLKLGINGIFTYKKNEDLRETVRKVGLDKILLETDCPYLPPQIARGQRNSPVYIPVIAQFMADFLGKLPQEVAEVTTQNCAEVFGLDF